MLWTHPDLGPIGPIVRKDRPLKVWKHFYDPVERWDVLTEHDPQQLHDQAVASGCPAFAPERRPPRLTWPQERLLREHHDQAYAPAYFEQMADASTAWGPKLRDRTRWIARTPRSVIVVVQLASAPRDPARVKTAYRPHPEGLDVPWDEEDFQRQADYVFGKETGMSRGSGWATQVAGELERCSASTVDTVQDAWWLCLAIGHGRLLDAPEIREPLTRAQRRWEQVDPKVASEVARALRTDVLVDRLASALQEEEPEDLEATLWSIEDALAAAAVLSLPQVEARLLEESQSLLAWISPELTQVADTARGRLEALDDSDAPVVQLWSTVEEAALGANLREAPATRRPGPSVAAQLLPEREGVLDWLSRAVQQAGTTLEGWAEVMLDGATLMRRAPVMGSPRREDEQWTLRARREPGSGRVRVFVVDADYPEGREVTDYLGDETSTLWNVESPGAELHLVIVAAPDPIEGTSLEEVLRHARSSDDVTVRARRFTRPR